jgi:hypothetical protein
MTEMAATLLTLGYRGIPCDTGKEVCVMSEAPIEDDGMSWVTGFAAALRRLPAEKLDEIVASFAAAGLDDLAESFEELADRAAILESLAEPGDDIPWEQVKSEAGL